MVGGIVEIAWAVPTLPTAELLVIEGKSDRLLQLNQVRPRSQFIGKWINHLCFPSRQKISGRCIEFRGVKSIFAVGDRASNAPVERRPTILKRSNKSSFAAPTTC